MPENRAADVRMTGDDVVVACVQQRLRIYATLDEYRTDLQRFLRIAQHKHARLVIFPELAGIMLGPPLLHSQRITMLKYADLSTRRRASWQQRTVGQVAQWGAAFLQLDLFTEVAHWFKLINGWQQYCDLFGELARTFHIVLVAPSAYLPDPADQVVRNIAGVFGESGELLGYQAKVMLHEQDKAFSQPGTDWQVIPTSVGSLGLMLGSDVLFPEVGRLLAYKGAEILIAQGACRDMSLYHKLRAGILARMQDNQLFAAASFLVGRTTFSRRDDRLFVGKSAIFAPQELTPRFNGVLVEMGNPRSEGVLSAKWNFESLKEVWEMSDPAVRKEFPLKQIGVVLSNLYARLQNLSASDTPLALPANTEQDEAKTQPLPLRESILHLDDLPVKNTITRRWPLVKLDYPSLPHHEGAPTMPPILPVPPIQTSLSSVEVPKTTPESVTPSSIAEDETEEMDALPGDTSET
ncbi:MAG: nitrilase-related carbon-nitrogen hydrolase [Caldilineaceae bacterium]